jgi:hypothetical protein
VRRVLAGAKKAGVNVQRVEITPDKITVFTGPSSEATGSNPWDKVLEGAEEEKRTA